MKKESHEALKSRVIAAKAKLLQRTPLQPAKHPIQEKAYS
jgi:hypothetical protein